MKLQELSTFKYKIKESEHRPGVLMTVEGVFQRADKKNANGRVYPTELWHQVLRQDDVVSRLQNRQMVGMLGHPQDGQTDPEKISHIVTRQDLAVDGTLIGEADILDTPTGRITATLFAAGVQLGISSRGDGSIEKQGGDDIVQNDYRLETYDFVLKPSTPGAYPSVVENVEENEKLVVSALEGLVKKELPEKQRVPVLLECLEILSGLERGNSDLIKSLSQRITEAVGGKRTLVSVVANDTIQEENRMPEQPKDGALTLEWHRKAVNEAVHNVAGKKDKEISHLKEQVLKLQSEGIKLSKRYRAAEMVIEDTQKKLKAVKEAKVLSADRNLKRRYEAALDLLDEAIKKLPEVGVQRRRASALEQLLQASIDKFKGDKLESVLKRANEKLPEGLRESAKPLFKLCKTPEQVSETFKTLMYANGKQEQRKEPLPTVKKPVVEGKTEGSKGPSNPAAPATDFASRVNDRLLRAVNAQ